MQNEILIHSSAASKVVTVSQLFVLKDLTPYPWGAFLVSVGFTGETLPSVLRHNLLY